MLEAPAERRFAWLSKSTVLLACSSLFADISTEMLYPILPVFLTQTLGASGSDVGLIDGIAQATQNFAQGLSGWLSDRLQKRKSIALIGYLLAAISKPLIGLSTVWQGVLGARFLDRIGTGTRSAPRDALVASSVDAQHRGKAFGLESFGDNLGAFLGPLLTVFLLAFLQFEMRFVFFLAIVPGLLAFLMAALVVERPVRVAAKSTLDAGLWHFPKAYWKYLFVTALFTLGCSSNSFIILQTQSVGASIRTTILIYATFNLAAALASYPAGHFSDQWGRRNILLLALAIFCVAYLGFALTTNIALIALLFTCYGAYQGIFRAVGKALASDFAPEHLRASGIGWYNATIGLVQLAASIVAGLLWDRIGHAAVFFYGATFAMVGGIALAAMIPSRTGSVSRN
jgi:MFS family permease